MDDDSEITVKARGNEDLRGTGISRERVAKLGAEMFGLMVSQTSGPLEAAAAVEVALRLLIATTSKTATPRELHDLLEAASEVARTIEIEVDVAIGGVNAVGGKA